MDYTIIARKGEDGKPVAGTFEVTRRDDSRIGARGWWGGRSMMGLLAAEREAEQRNGGQRRPADAPKAISGELGNENQALKAVAKISR
jgi:hypothetical protein